MIADDPQHQQIQLALKLSARMEELILHNKDAMRFPDSVADEMVSAAKGYAQLNTALAYHYNSEGRRLFDVTIKMHFLIHAAQNSRYLNPRLGWCYSGEDFMNKARQLARSCMKGTPLWKYGSKFASKYILGMTLRMRERSQWLQT